ncbi:MAG: helix-turn-helix transcriptional regulator [Nanoarchaeota archaeon]
MVQKSSGKGAQVSACDDSLDTLRSNLTRYRKENGLTKKDLAGRIDQAPNTIYLIEAGRRLPSLCTLRKICDLYKVRIADLFSAPMPVSQTAAAPDPVIQGVIHKFIGNPGWWALDTYVESAKWCSRPDPGLEVRVHIYGIRGIEGENLPNKMVLPKMDGVEFILSYYNLGVTGSEHLNGRLVAAYYSARPPKGLELVALRRRD